MIWEKNHGLLVLKRLTKTFEPPVKILLEYDLETKDIYQVIYVTVQIDVWSFILKGQMMNIFPMERDN